MKKNSKRNTFWKFCITCYLRILGIKKININGILSKVVDDISMVDKIWIKKHRINYSYCGKDYNMEIIRCDKNMDKFGIAILLGNDVVSEHLIETRNKIQPTIKIKKGLQISPFAKAGIDYFLRTSDFDITIFDILKQAGFDIEVPSKLYIGGIKEQRVYLTYEYRDEKYEIEFTRVKESKLGSSVMTYIKLKKINPFFPEWPDREVEYLIKEDLELKEVSLEEKKIEINENIYLKKNKNGDINEVNCTEEHDFYFCYQEIKADNPFCDSLID